MPTLPRLVSKSTSDTAFPATSPGVEGAVGDEDLARSPEGPDSERNNLPTRGMSPRIGVLSLGIFVTSPFLARYQSKPKALLSACSAGIAATSFNSSRRTTGSSGAGAAAADGKPVAGSISPLRADGAATTSGGFAASRPGLGGGAVGAGVKRRKPAT